VGIMVSTVAASTPPTAHPSQTRTPGSDECVCPDFAITLIRHDLARNRHGCPELSLAVGRERKFSIFTPNDPARAPAPRLAPHCRYPAPYCCAGMRCGLPAAWAFPPMTYRDHPCMVATCASCGVPPRYPRWHRRPVRRFAATHSLSQAAVELDLSVLIPTFQYSLAAHGNQESLGGEISFLPLLSVTLTTAPVYHLNFSTFAPVSYESSLAKYPLELFGRCSIVVQTARCSGIFKRSSSGISQAKIRMRPGRKSRKVEVVDGCVRSASH